MKTNQFLLKLLSITVIVILFSIALGAQPAKAASLSATGTFCDQYYSTSNGNYQTMTNYWNKAGSAPNTQCINITTTGFSITTQDQVCATNGAPCSYPAIYVGCHYSTCSPNTNLPMQISAISSANTNVTVTYPGSGTYDAAYDIWLNADTNVSGVQDTEIMIWLSHAGSVQPIGSMVGTITLAGVVWDVWVGNNGQNNVVSYSRVGMTSFNTDVKPFLLDAITRGSGFGTTAWYLTSMQMGFEPWSGGTGLTVNSFSATITAGGGGATSTPTKTATKTATPTRTNTPGGPTPTPTKTATPTATSAGGGGSTCSPVANTYTAAFDHAGPVSSVCIRFNNLPNDINSWGMTSVMIGGTNYANMWVSKNDATFISKKAADGYWYAVITAPDSNGHFRGE